MHTDTRQGIKRGNVHAVSNAWKVQKFHILPVDFRSVCCVLCACVHVCMCVVCCCVLCVLCPHANVLLLHVLTMVVPCLHLSPYAALFCGRAHVCSVPGGELGPTLKLKRPVVVKKYHEQIDALYSSADE